MIIYKVTNLTDNKVYIGQTVGTLKKRKSVHICYSKKSFYHFHNALCKYGEGNFKWQVICICPNIDSLNEQEKYYIAYYDSMNSGYNSKSGGKNSIPTKEVCQKISKSNKGKIFTKEHCKNISKTKVGKNNPMYMVGENHWNYGRKCSCDTKNKIRQSMLGDKNHFFGKRHTEKSKQLMRDNQDNKGKNNNMYGKTQSDETKKKISESLKKYFKRIKNGI